MREVFSAITQEKLDKEKEGVCLNNNEKGNGNNDRTQ